MKKAAIIGVGLAAIGGSFAFHLYALGRAYQEGYKDGRRHYPHDLP